MTCLTKECRNKCVGLAILWIMLYHTRCFSLPILDFFRIIGYGGVDICLFFSGVGIFHSLKSYNNLSAKNCIDFYKKRLIRVLPEYVLVVMSFSIIMCILKELSYIDIVFNVTTLFYWISPRMSFNWYIPALLFLYFISPIIYIIINKSYHIGKKYISFLLFLVIAVCYSSSIIQYHFDIDRFLNLTLRIPIYFLGFCYAKCMTVEGDLQILGKRRCLYYSLLIIGNVGLYWWMYSSIRANYHNDSPRYFAFLFIVPALCLLSCEWWKKMERYKIGKIICSLLNYVGKNSLMFYLVSVALIRIGNVIIEDKYVNTHALLYNLCLILFTFLLVYIYQLISGIWKKMSKNSKI